MKKIKIIASLLLPTFLFFGTTFISCDQPSSTTTDSEQESSESESGGGGSTEEGSTEGGSTEGASTEGASTEGASTTPAVIAASTAGSVAAAANGRATLEARNGTYTFISSSSASANIRAAVDTSQSGTWEFKNKLGITKYSGDYEGDIADFGSEEVKLELTIEEAMDFLGEEIAVKEEKSFDFEASTDSFQADIPEVTVPQPITQEALINFGYITGAFYEGNGSMTDLTNWMNTYGQNEYNTTFTTSKYVSEDAAYVRHPAGWNIDPETRECVLMVPPVPEGEVEVTITVKFYTNGRFESYPTGDEPWGIGGSPEDPEDVSHTFGYYTISEDGEYYLAVDDTGANLFCIDEDNPTDMIMYPIGVNPKLGGGTVKIQYVINGVEDIMDECTPDVLVGLGTDMNICLDKEGTQPVSVTAEVQGELITYSYTPTSGGEAVVIGVDSEADPEAETETSHTFYVVINNDN